MSHVMVDLETLSTSDNALIVSIGAVRFNPLAPEVFDRFHIGIDLDSLPANAYGFDISPGTVGWWLASDRAAGREALKQIDKTDIGSALDGFALWLGEDAKVWGNGVAFDNVILRNAYVKLGLQCPWGFWDDRCYRTIKNLAPELKAERIGAHHSALDDALTQVSHLQKLVSYLRLTEVD